MCRNMKINNKNLCIIFLAILLSMAVTTSLFSWDMTVTHSGDVFFGTGDTGSSNSIITVESSNNNPYARFFLRTTYHNISLKETFYSPVWSNTIIDATNTDDFPANYGNISPGLYYLSWRYYISSSAPSGNWGNFYNSLTCTDTISFIKPISINEDGSVITYNIHLYDYPYERDNPDRPITIDTNSFKYQLFDDEFRTVDSGSITMVLNELEGYFEGNFDVESSIKVGWKYLCISSLYSFDYYYAYTNLIQFRNMPSVFFCRDYSQLQITGTEVNGVTTTSNCQPRFGDNITLHWKKTLGCLADEIVILKEDNNGDIAHNSKNYSIYDTLPLETYEDLPISSWGHYLVLDNERRTNWVQEGSVTWQPPADADTGEYLIAYRYGNNEIQQIPHLPNSSNTIYLYASVYDIYADRVIYPSDEEPVTRIYYTLSGDVTSCVVRVRDGNYSTGDILFETEGETTAGVHYVEWDGYDTEGNPRHTGIYPITVIINQDYNDSLQRYLFLLWEPIYTLMDSVQEQRITPNFAPEDNEKIKLIFDLRTHWPRPHVESATVTSIVYSKSDGSIVRVLRNEDFASILSYAEGFSWDDGKNEIIWDGRDDNGEFVSPGDYILTLIATDDVGCQSLLQRYNITVNPSSSPKDLIVYGADDEEQNKVTGYSSASSVTWSDGSNGSGSVTFDSEGYFEFYIPNTPGLHNVTVHVPNDNDYIPETLDVFINDFELGNVSIASANPAPMSMMSTTSNPDPEDNELRFTPDEGESVSVSFNTLAQDYVNIKVINPYYATKTIAPNDPMPAFMLLNGFVESKDVRTIWSNQVVMPGTSTFAWDGKDDNGNYVPAGEYIIEITRANEDRLKPLYLPVHVTVEKTGDPIVISNLRAQVVGKTIAISWETDVATTGNVLYNEIEEVDEGYVFNVAGKVFSDEESTFHIVYIHDTKPETTYACRVFAETADGSTIIGEYGSVISGEGDVFDEIYAYSNEDDEMEISWETEENRYARLSYAKVGPEIDELGWITVEERDTNNQLVFDTEHLIILDNLDENSEYVFRVDVSESASFAAASTSSYSGFTTKNTRPELEIISPEYNEFVDNTTFEVVVKASDEISRFNENGISNIELTIDYSQYTGTMRYYAEAEEYIFTVDASDLSLGQHTIRVTAEDDFWNTNDKQIDIMVREAPEVQMFAAGAPSNNGLPKNRVKAEGCVNTKCPLGDWSKSKSALKEYRKQANIILGPDNYDEMKTEADKRNGGTDDYWYWKKRVHKAERRAYTFRSSLSPNEEIIIHNKCHDKKHIKEFFTDSCLLFGGFTFIGHGGPGSLYVAIVKENGVWFEYAFIDDLDMRSTKSGPKYLHLYSCWSNMLTWKNRLNIDDYYYVGYNNLSRSGENHLYDIDKGKGWGKFWHRALMLNPFPDYMYRL